MLFIDFSSAFNTVIPSKLISKLSQLGISNSLCNWIMYFLTNRTQADKLGSLYSSTFTLSRVHFYPLKETYYAFSTLMTYKRCYND